MNDAEIIAVDVTDPTSVFIWTSHEGHNPGPERTPSRRERFVTPSTAACTPDSLWRLRPLLLQIVRSNQLNASIIFTYRSIQRAVRRHINKYKDIYTDAKSKNTIRCHNTELGRAFDISSFHRSQLDVYIRKNLLPA